MVDGQVSRSGFDYDAELSRYQRLLCEAMDVQPSDRVLDIGCGGGQTTRAAARLATQGSALGVDTSSAMLQRARQLTAAEELHNVRFEQADAQVHPFPPAHFTLGISRFGTMFFADPVEAFTNIGRALQPGARLVHLVWQGSDRQEWVAAIGGAIASSVTLAAGAFTMADPSIVDSVMTAAGFTGISITDVSEPIFYGADPDAAVDSVVALDMVSDLPADETERALDRLRSVMVAHNTTDGVWFDSRAWLITASYLQGASG